MVGENHRMSEHGPDVTLVRHGETPWSLSGQHTGRTEIELTAKGEEQAKAAGALVGSAPFDLVLCSPRQRAQRTAELAGLVPFEIDDDLVEWDYGDFEGLTSAEIHATLPAWDIWHGPWPGGETAEQVAARARRVVERVLALGPDKRVALVAHGHILRVLATQWAELDVTIGRRLALETAAVCELGWEHDYRVIRRWDMAPQ
jgi:broad specificity phosphatase PhoE